MGDSAVIGRQRAKTSVLKPSYSSSNFSVKSKEKLCSNTSVTILEEEDKVVIIDSDLKKQEKSDVNDSGNTEVKAIIEEFSKLINVYNKELKILAEQVKNNKNKKVPVCCQIQQKSKKMSTNHFPLTIVVLLC